MLPPFISSIAVLLGSVLSAHSDADKMQTYFATGKAAEISEYFNPSIQLYTPGKEGVYSKVQAKMILTEFFDKTKPAAAGIKTKGYSENGAQYIILDLGTAEGTFKVNIFYRGSGNKLRIHELKIEK